MAIPGKSPGIRTFRWNNLAVTGLELASLLNFGEASLKQERIVRYKK